LVLLSYYTGIQSTNMLQNYHLI